MSLIRIVILAKARNALEILEVLAKAAAITEVLGKNKNPRER